MNAQLDKAIDALTFTSWSGSVLPLGGTQAPTFVRGEPRKQLCYSPIVLRL
jgi:hypothetical protein